MKKEQIEVLCTCGKLIDITDSVKLDRERMGNNTLATEKEKSINQRMEKAKPRIQDSLDKSSDVKLKELKKYVDKKGNSIYQSGYEQAREDILKMIENYWRNELCPSPEMCKWHTSTLNKLIKQIQSKQ